MSEEIIQLGQYGLVGVMLALIGAVIYVCWINYKTTGNHINHSTTAIDKNTEVLGQLENSITKLTTLLEERLRK